MKVAFDELADAAYFRLNDLKIVESEEVAPGVICDFDDHNRVVGFEILGVKQRTPEQLKGISFPFEEQDRIRLHELFNLFAGVAG